MTGSAPEMYLDLLKRCLTRTLFPDKSITPSIESQAPGDFRLKDRIEGFDWPSEAETMVGVKRLDNVQQCVVDVLRRGVAGDLVETGVWRGGTSIFMRGILAAYGDHTRTVWLADSFQGLPRPDEKKYPKDAGDPLWKVSGYLGVSLEEVKENFRRYCLLDEQVRFLPGWFKDTLPRAPIQQISVLRLDGDMYESTMDALNSLYAKVSEGGYIIVDDYGALPNCKAAIHDFRDAHNINDEMHIVDWTGVYWQKSASAQSHSAA
jgi:O-methyltransferase